MNTTTKPLNIYWAYDADFDSENDCAEMGELHAPNIEEAKAEVRKLWPSVTNLRVALTDGSEPSAQPEVEAKSLKTAGNRFMVSPDGQHAAWVHPAEVSTRAPGWTDCTDMGDVEFALLMEERRRQIPLAA